MASFADKLENKAYSFPPAGKMLDVYNGIRNRVLLKCEEKKFERQMNMLLEDEDLLTKFGSEPFEDYRFVHVKVLGVGASGKVVLVKDKKQNENYIALKEIDFKSHLRSNLKTYQYNNIGHKLRTTSPNERVLRSAFKFSPGNRPEDKPAKKAPRELLSSLIYTELSEVHKEVEVLRRLRDCPYVIDFLGTFVDMAEKRIYISTEYCEYPLAYFIRKNKIFDFTELQAVIPSIVYGLYEMHRQGYVHMDLKPENILIKSDGGIRLCDFGSVASIGTKPLQITLTYRYVSPELFFIYHRSVFDSSTYQGVTTLDAFYDDADLVKCDVWALGIIVMTLAVGITAVDKFFGCEWNSLAKDEFHVMDMIMYTLDGGNPHNEARFDSLLQLLEAKREQKKYGFLLERLEELFKEGAVGTRLLMLLQSLLMFDRRKRATIEYVCSMDFIVQDGEIDSRSLSLTSKSAQIIRALVGSADTVEANETLK
mmetsp:Transcript_16627/g.19923  ORF Transcript_16627/g.19923 Transcript_16627/m.19923 type:complete len:481 (+) Transcript_16627:368-1810(+)